MYFFGNQRDVEISAAPLNVFFLETNVVYFWKDDERGAVNYPKNSFFTVYR
jgi:hypothetical protein